MRSLKITLFSGMLICYQVSNGAGAQTNISDKRAGLIFLRKQDQRISDISWRLTSTNLQYCQERMSTIGLSLHDAAQYAPSYRDAAIAEFGFGNGLPAVLAVAKGGPADLAGLMVGDQLIAVDGTRFAVSEKSSTAKEDYSPIDSAMSKVEKLPVDRDIQLEIERDGLPRYIAVRPRTICRSRVEVVPSNAINANSNGFTVQIYGRLALWARNDDELAIVIAHEMAHNILKHNDLIKREKIRTGSFASLGSDGAKLRDMERQADRLGLYLVRNAGYDYAIAGDFWSRLAATSGLGAIWATSHPTAKDRKAFSQQIIDEMGARP